MQRDPSQKHRKNLALLFQLFNACKSSNKQELKSLLALNMDPDQRDDQGYPILYLAVKSVSSPDCEFIELLLKAKSNPNLFVTVKQADGTSVSRTIFQHMVHDFGDEQWELALLFSTLR